MIRRLIAAGSALSLLLCPATMALWVWVAVKPIQIGWGNSQRAIGYMILVSNGEVSFQKHWSDRLVVLQDGEVSDAMGNTSGWDGVGIHFHRGTIVKRASTAGPIMPGVYGRWTEFWFELAWPLMLSLPLAAWAMFRMIRRGTRRSRRRALGLCMSCGYDLRASPERCPECGAPITGEGRDRNVPAAAQGRQE